MRDAHVSTHSFDKRQKSTTPPNLSRSQALPFLHIILNSATCLTSNMFLPENLKEKKESADAEAKRKEAYAQIEKWSMEIIPAHLRDGVVLSVQEVQCGDPDCSPIDTAIAIIFSK